MKKCKISKLSCLLVVVILIATMVSFAIVPASAETTSNTAVSDVASSLLQVRMVYNLDNSTKISVQGGSSFLINENTILTCAHVVDLDPEVEYELKAIIGQGYDKSKLSYEVVVRADVTIPATIKKVSRQYDFAILILNEAIGNREIAKLDPDSEVTRTQTVFALGFPAKVSVLQDKNMYTSDDVTITSGDVQKKTQLKETQVIQHGADLTPGNSGGPLVGEDGNVIGINTSTSGEYNYALCINQVTQILDDLQIIWTPFVSSPETTSTENTVESTVAPSTVSTEQVESTSSGGGTGKDKIDLPKLIIIIVIIVLALVLVGIVIAFVVYNSKKKNGPKGPKGPQGPSGASFTPVTPNKPVPPSQMNMSASPTSMTFDTNDGAGETSILNTGAGETSVLGAGMTSAGSYSMLRKSNNERFVINKSEFVIGKERRRVDYCISNNSSISRTHAKIKIRGGRCYITDLGSTNCTYVNGTKLSPNVEVVLSKGDKVILSDEEFEFLG